MEEKGNLVAVSLPLTHTLHVYPLILDGVDGRFSQKLEHGEGCHRGGRGWRGRETLI